MGNLGFLFSLATIVHGHTTFTPNCTSPDQPVNFVVSPEGRETLDILWSSLFTIIACTWTILLLNVPEQRDGRDPGWKGDLKRGLKGIWTKLEWMVLTILAPEMIVCLWADNLAHSKSELSRLKEFADLDGVPWSLTHSRFADMGGFVLRGTWRQTDTRATPSLEARSSTSTMEENSQDPPLTRSTSAPQPTLGEKKMTTESDPPPGAEFAPDLSLTRPFGAPTTEEEKRVFLTTTLLGDPEATSAASQTASDYSSFHLED